MAHLHWQHDGKAPEPDGERYEKWMRQAGLAREVDPPKDPQAISKTEADRRKTIAQWRKIEFENQVAAGLHIKRADSDAEYHRIMAAVRTKVEQFVGAMPEMFHGATRERIAKLATDRYDRICREIHALERAVGVAPEPDSGKDKQKAKAVSRRHNRRKV
jgi:hypothetical protein